MQFNSGENKNPECEAKICKLQFRRFERIPVFFDRIDRIVLSGSSCESCPNKNPRYLSSQNNAEPGREEK